jgi:hypothetical protein
LKQNHCGGAIILGGCVMDEINELRSMDSLDAIERGVEPPVMDFEGGEKFSCPASDTETVARCLWESSPGFGSFRRKIPDDGIVFGQRK